MKIFLLEDDYILNKSISHYFTSKNFEVLSFTNGLTALDSVYELYDIALLDIDTPDVNGITLLKEIHTAFPHRPVIMISATIDINTILKAYDIGCTDYMKKPFDIRELEIKIASLTRNLETRISLSESLIYDIHKQRLYHHDTEIVLTPKEHKLFSILLEKKGETVQSELIENVIWGIDGSSTHLRQLVARLRKKIPENIILNRTGSGYCII